MAAIFRNNKINVIIGYVWLFFAFIYQLVSTLVILFVPRRLRLKRKDITGQKILITGAGSGLGRQLAIEFSKHGTCLLLVDINRQSLQETQKLVDGRSTVFIYECDVSDYKKVYEMAEKVKRDAGDVDILVNNAGIVTGKFLLDLPEDKIVRTMEVNALAHFWTVRAFLPAMMKRNFGHVVSIVSIFGKVGNCKVTDYAASKYAAVGFAESLEIELREKKLDGIKVTITYPSLMDTGLFEGVTSPFGSPLSPEYAAKEIALGVLEEQEIIYLPFYIRFVILCKEWFPRWTAIMFGDMTGGNNTMANFNGRQSNAVNKPEKTD